MTDEFLVIGHIKKAVGLKGMVLIRVYSQAESITYSGRFFIRNTHSCFKQLDIKDYRIKGKRQILCNISGIDTRDKAEAIKNKKVYQRLEFLPPLKENEFYLYELKGLIVLDKTGKSLGRIETILETGANDCLLVKNENGELLIPMMESFIKEIDKDEKRCIIDLPPGFLEATFTPYKRK